MSDRPPPLPSVVVRDDRPTSNGSALGVTTGRRCTVCEAWAPHYARLRHADGCKGADCG
jgi:hypothetical protein